MRACARVRFKKNKKDKFTRKIQQILYKSILKDALLFLAVKDRQYLFNEEPIIGICERKNLKSKEKVTDSKSCGTLILCHYSVYTYVIFRLNPNE